ncbi:MAG TPA: diacylglycerol kinase family protein [Planctomycetota bacterium]|nr:diacylglycerol kinase family protein [Planctomycetota bacterium]
MTKPKRLLVFVNPAAGEGQADAVLGRTTQRLRFEQVSLEVHHASKGDELAAAARSARLKDVDAVLVLGGDGTVSSVVHGLLSRPPEASGPAAPSAPAGSAKGQPHAPPPLALLPVGKGNALATNLGISDVEAGLAALLAGETRSLDAIAVSAQGFRFHALTVVGWGLAVDVAERRRRWSALGRAGRGLALRLESMRARPRYARLDVQLAGRAEEVVQGPYTLVMLANTRHTGHGMPDAPRAVLDDGLLELVEVLPLGLGRRLGVLRALWAGRSADSPAVRWRRVRGVSLSQPSIEEVLASDAAPGGQGAQPSREPLRLYLDGDLYELAAGSDVSIRVLPRALAVFAPKAEAVAGKA